MLGTKLPKRKKRKIETAAAAEGEEGAIARPEV
jgi:hypothetical protein